MLLAREQRRQQRRRSASLDANGGDESEEDKAGNIDFDANVNGDTDDGIWPAEFMVPTIVVTEPEMEMVVTRITPEEVGRAIGAAFAIGTAA